MKDDKLKSFKTIEEAQNFIREEKTVIKGITTFENKILICYYTKQ